MVAWSGRRGWEFREELAVPGDLDVAGLDATRAFLHRTVRGDRSALRRTVALNIERVTVTTNARATFECRALPRALAVVEPPDEVVAVHLEIVAGWGHDKVVLDWRADGTSTGEVTGRSRAWVVGVHGVLQQFFDERRFTAAPVRHTRPGRRWPWLSNVSTEVVAAVVSSAVVALLGALLARFG